MSRPVLVVDDESNMRRILEAIVTREGHEVQCAANGREALEALHEGPFAAVITDLRMPEMDGIELLGHIKETFPDIPTIVITAFGTVEAAVDALKKGAIDFITKPFDQDQIKIAVKKAVRIYQANLQEASQPAQFEGKWDSVGHSSQMQAVYDLVSRTADSPSSVLITGESGTGKELIAKALHENSSRPDGPFIKINCAAIPENLIESEFFGHEKGAFTGAVTSKPGRFELANGGTLFLDEIGEITREMQVKLLRVLQEREIERVGGLRTIKVDFRLISATNQDLEAEVRNGSFRQDLYYRLNVVPIHLPPLRDRKEDIPLLAEHFLKVFSKRLRRNVTGISESAVRKLRTYHWPGNIRELENVLERSVLLAEGEVLGPEQVNLPNSLAAPVTPDGPGMPSRPLKEVIKEETTRLEREMIRRVLESHDGNVTRAAKDLQISRKSLQLKMKEYGLREE